jgi:toxin ParE1/3/4
MAKSEIIWTEESCEWLRRIREYIAKDRPEAADRVVEGIWQKAQMLSANPEAGFKYPLPLCGRNDIRVLVYGHYRIAYLVGERTVSILGVFHAALDIDRYFPNIPK